MPLKHIVTDIICELYPKTDTKVKAQAKNCMRKGPQKNLRTFVFSVYAVCATG